MFSNLKNKSGLKGLIPVSICCYRLLNDTIHVLLIDTFTECLLNISRNWEWLQIVCQGNIGIVDKVDFYVKRKVKNKRDNFSLVYFMFLLSWLILECLCTHLSLISLKLLLMFCALLKALYINLSLKQLFGGVLFS